MSRHALFILVVLSFGVACGRAPAPSGTSAPATTAPAEARSIQEELGLTDVPKADPREPRIAAAIAELLEREHVRPHVIDDALSQKAFKRYLDALDPGKLFLLQPQVDILNRDATRLDDQLHAGDLTLARTGAALVARERKAVAQVVADILQTPFDFSAQESIETDPKKVVWAANEAERRDRWQRTLKQQALERIERMADSAKAAEKQKEDKGKKKTESAPEDDDEESPRASLEPPPPTFEGREKKARDDLARDYEGRFSRLAKAEPLEAAETFINAVAGVFDPHTLYLAPEQQENFDIQISGSLEGIGAVLTEDAHYISVREVVPGGAAWREGQLEAGDLILAVKQDGGTPVDVADMRINEVVRMIRGPKGTLVTLTIKKPDERVQLISIKRDLVVVEDAYARGALLSPGSKQQFGYIYLPSFYGNTRSTKGQTPERDATTDVRALLTRFAAEKIPGVVIDLRGNGGGLLNHANDITGLLIDRGPVVAARGAEGKLQVLGDTDPGVVYGGNVVVLVDRFSASASEILAGALQDYGRALIVGTGPTHGKGTVQAMVDLDRVDDRRSKKSKEPLGVAKLTIQQFYLVDGESTQWRGVEPDVVLPDPASHVESGERYLENAIPWSQVAPLPATPWLHPNWDAKQLAEKSLERQAAQPVFGKVRERGAYLLTRRKETQVPLNREAWLAQRSKDKEVLEALDLKLEDGPARLTVKLVDYRPEDKEQVQQPARKGATRVDKWKNNLAHDPWVEEAVFLLSDMAGTQVTKK